MVQIINKNKSRYILLINQLLKIITVNSFAAGPSNTSSQAAFTSGSSCTITKETTRAAPRTLTSSTPVTGLHQSTSEFNQGPLLEFEKWLMEDDLMNPSCPCVVGKN